LVRRKQPEKNEPSAIYEKNQGPQDIEKMGKKKKKSHYRLKYPLPRNCWTGLSSQKDLRGAPRKGKKKRWNRGEKDHFRAQKSRKGTPYRLWSKEWEDGSYKKRKPTTNPVRGRASGNGKRKTKQTRGKGLESKKKPGSMELPRKVSRPG